MSPCKNKWASQHRHDERIPTAPFGFRFKASQGSWKIEVSDLCRCGISLKIISAAPWVWSTHSLVSHQTLCLPPNSEERTQKWPKEESLTMFSLPKSSILADLDNPRMMSQDYLLIAPNIYVYIYIYIYMIIYEYLVSWCLHHHYHIISSSIPSPSPSAQSLGIVLGIPSPLWSNSRPRRHQILFNILQHSSNILKKGSLNGNSHNHSISFMYHYHIIHTSCVYK